MVDFISRAMICLLKNSSDIVPTLLYRNPKVLNLIFEFFFFESQGCIEFSNGRMSVNLNQTNHHGIYILP